VLSGGQTMLRRSALLVRSGGYVLRGRLLRTGHGVLFAGRVLRADRVVALLSGRALLFRRRRVSAAGLLSAG